MADRPLESFQSLKKRVLASGLDRHVLPMGEVRETKLNEPSQAVLDLPFYGLISHLSPVDTLKWKIYVRQRCVHDLEFRELIHQACAADPCFFSNTLVWIFEPRPPRPIPLTLWPDQADVLAWMAECYDTHRDCGVEKTRGIGISWTLADLFYWLWRFVPECKLGVMTKDETVLDGPDSNTLMGKVAYIHEKMPAWLRLNKQGVDVMKRTSKDHLMQCTANGATLQGFPPMDSKVRSLRFTVFAYDEFGYFPRDAQESLNASVHTAPTRYFISTWHGHNNAFHEIMRVEKNTLLRVLTYWWNNPERWKGCYTTEAQRLKILDTDYEYPSNYRFVLDGLLRSPWVDYELSRAGSKVQTALEELYGLQAEAGRKLLRASTIEMARESLQPPSKQGDIDTAVRDTIFRCGEGLLKVWGDIQPGQGGPFSVGCDLAHGLGASYSTLVMFSLEGGEQVAEFADNQIDPVSFARYVVDVCRWVSGDKGDGQVYLTFENNGNQGTVFGKELQRLGYGNVHRRKYAGKVPRSEVSTYMGIRNKDGGLAVLAELERAVRDGECVVRSTSLVDELALFNKDEDGKPDFPRGSGGHGDIAMAAAMAWDQARERVLAVPEEVRKSAYAELENIPHERKRWSTGWRISA